MAILKNLNKQQQRQVMPTSSMPFELKNGETVPLEISWSIIERLRVSRDECYADFTRVLTKGSDDVMDQIRVLYAAYRGGYLSQNGNIAGAMSYMEFLDLVPDDMRGVMETVAALLDPKSSRDSEALS